MTRSYQPTRCHRGECCRSTALRRSGSAAAWTLMNVIGTADRLRFVLVVCLASTSGMSILQTAITSYLQRNCYKRVVHFNVRCLFFFFFPPPCNGIHCAVRGQTGRALSAPINKSEEGSGLFHPSLVWSCVCRAGGSEEEEEVGDPDSSMFPAAVPLWELHTAIKHLMAAR